MYVAHQATVGSSTTPPGSSGAVRKIVVDVDHYGNTSSGSIPRTLADAAADGHLKHGGAVVLMTGWARGSLGGPR